MIVRTHQNLLNKCLCFQTLASAFPGVEDDLVFSGAGSGCNTDDEDECTPVFESGSGTHIHCVPYDIRKPHR
jgi:hypothetical protein